MAVGHYHAYFAEGYTGRGYQEYLSLLNPQTHSVQAHVSIYRLDGTVHAISMIVASLSRTTLNMNTLVPRTSTSLRVDTTSQIVAERALYYGNGHVVAGAPAPSRRWYVTEGYVGATFSDSLRIFNPGTVTATVTIAAYRSDGAGRLSQRVIASGARLNVALDDIACTGGSALVIQGNVPIVVESVVGTTSASGPSAAMALPNVSSTWYFLDGGTSTGNSGYISSFNPNTRTADVRLRPVTADGYGLPVLYHVKPHARAVFVVRTYIQRAGLAAVVEVNRQIAAQEVRYAVTGAVSLVDGTPGTTRVWGLADGYNGHGFKEWIILFNPRVSEAIVRLRLIRLVAG